MNERSSCSGFKEKSPTISSLRQRTYTMEAVSRSSVATLSSACRSIRPTLAPSSKRFLRHAIHRQSRTASNLAPGLHSIQKSSPRPSRTQSLVLTNETPIHRSFTTSSPLSATATDGTEPPITSPQSSGGSRSPYSMGSLSRSIGFGQVSQDKAKPLEEVTASYQRRGEHHLYIYAHRHNTHITLTGPQFPDPKSGRIRQNIILTLSCGNIGYRKSQRSTFDASYQLGAYFMSRIQNDGILMKIQQVELVFRGFGNGREALTKIILGQEGSVLRDRIVRVVDASRIKFGGQRAPRPRRLG